MSVVGIDFGTLHSKIGVARRKGIDIITNEVSNRATPSLVAFGIKQRQLGESAKTAEIGNFRNTVGSLKRILGRTISDPEIQEVEKKFMNATLVDCAGTVGVQVKYLGETSTFSATQLSAMYLGKLRDIASKELGVNANDVVIAVPGWYTEVQRRATVDAALIAGLNPLRIINDTTATALSWGITKSDLPEADSPRHVAFVDVGHSSLSVSIVAFSKGQLTVKSTAYDRHLGGRDIDYALVNYFANEFKDKYKIDVLSNPKATFRLTTGCEKLKKILSANAEAPLSVESIMNDIDASSRLTREAYEELIAPVLARVSAPIEQALQESGLTAEQIDAVELIGGSTRIPAVRTRISAVFPGKTLMTTLNQDEAIARGATLACAQLSPVFKVREFKMYDITPYSVKIQWTRAPEDSADEDTELTVFPRGNGVPSTKILTFYRKGPFELEAVYADPSQLPGAVNPWLGKFTAKSVPSESGDLVAVKVKTRLSQHGVIGFEGAYVEESQEKDDGMEVDGEAPADGAAPKKKKTIIKKEVPCIVGYTGLSPEVIEKFKEQEAQMHASDKLVSDTEDRKNALEEYVYDTRGKLDERYAAYVQAPEKEKLLVALQEAEDWLYTEEGEDAQKSAYVTRLDALHKLGDPIASRYSQHEERQRVVSSLRETLNLYMSQATSGDEKYSHLDAKDLQSVVEKCATIQKWLDDQIARQVERPKNVDPVLTSADINKKRDEIIYFATPIFSKPKPKPTVTPGTETPKGDAPPPPPKTDAPAEEGGIFEEAPAEGPSEMDVD